MARSKALEKHWELREVTAAFASSDSFFIEKYLARSPVSTKQITLSAALITCVTMWKIVIPKCLTSDVQSFPIAQKAGHQITALLEPTSFFVRTTPTMVTLLKSRHATTWMIQHLCMLTFQVMYQSARTDT